MVVLGCVIIGYVATGGHLHVLWQPYEYLIILGSAIGAFIIANPSTVVGRTVGNLKRIAAGPTYHKKEYLQLLYPFHIILRTI